MKIEATYETAQITARVPPLRGIGAELELDTRTPAGALLLVVCGEMGEKLFLRLESDDARLIAQALRADLTAALEKNEERGRAVA